MFKCKECGFLFKEAGIIVETHRDLLKWVGWSFITGIPWIIKFLEGYDFKDIVISNRKKKQIKEILIESMTSGLSIPNIVDELNDVVKDRYRSEMIARSETIRAANEGALLQYKENEVKFVKFIAVPGQPDGRTCEKCLQLNGQEIAIEKAQGLIPVHPNCRCTYSAVI